MAAAIKGVSVTNPDAETKVAYAFDWEDVAKGKEAALSLVEWGADALVQSGDGTSFGIYEVCREKGVYVNGEWLDQYELAPKVMYTSVIMNWDPVLKMAISDIEKDNFMERYWMSLANGSYELAPYHEFENVIPEDVKRKVEQAKQDIISGKLRIRGN
jgi:basic membrane protein A